MKDSIYIIVARGGFQRAAKTPNFQLQQGERAFRLELEIPDEVFCPPQLPTVKMFIPRESLITELHVEAGLQVDEDARTEQT